MQLIVYRGHRTPFWQGKELMGLTSLLRGLPNTTLCWAPCGAGRGWVSEVICGQPELQQWELQLCQVLPWVIWKFLLCYEDKEWEGQNMTVGLGLRGLTEFLSAVQCTQWLCSSAILFPSLVISLHWSLINLFPSLATLLALTLF